MVLVNDIPLEISQKNQSLTVVSTKCVPFLRKQLVEIWWHFTSDSTWKSPKKPTKFAGQKENSLKKKRT